MRRFPRAMGAAQGVISLGGPGEESVAANFVTSASKQHDGTYEIQFVRRWGLGRENERTTWRFVVTREGTVQDLGVTGSLTPEIGG